MNRTARCFRGPVGFYRFKAELDGTIFPEWILLFDQSNFPFPPPCLQLFLARDCSFHRIGHLVIDEPRNSVAAGKSPHGLRPVLPSAANEFRCNANVECPVTSARKDIDARLPLLDVGAADSLDACAYRNASWRVS